MKVVTWVPKDTYINLLDSTSYKLKCNETTLIFNIISQLFKSIENHVIVNCKLTHKYLEYPQHYFSHAMTFTFLFGS